MAVHFQNNNTYSRNLLTLLCLTFFSISLRAATVVETPNTPEAIAKQYMDVMKKGDHAGCAALMHSRALDEFKKLLLPVFDAAEQAGDTKLLKFFEGAADYKSIRDLPPKDLFVNFMTGFSKNTPFVFDTLAKAELEIVGHVLEKEMTAHVLYRMKVVLNETSVVKLEVISLEKDGGAWRALLTGNIEGLAQMLLKHFKTKKAP